jgi:hypothetical protein
LNRLLPGTSRHRCLHVTGFAFIFGMGKAISPHFSIPIVPGTLLVHGRHDEVSSPVSMSESTSHSLYGFGLYEVDARAQTPPIW